MKVLITGSNGNLGTKLIDNCLKNGFVPVGTDFAVESTNNFLGHFEYFWSDIQESEKILSICLAAHPDIIIHTAAITDVDLCETEKELAYNINVVGTKNLLEISKATNCKLVFISTDYVFDGKTGNYSENDDVNPINYYGQNKLDAEKIIQDTLENYLIIRTSSLFGYSSNIKNNFLLWILKKLKNNEKVTLFDDQIVNPTLTDNLANNIISLINKDETGVFHLTGNEQISRYEFGEAICDIFNFDKSLLKKVKLNNFDFKAQRPKNSSLCVDKFISTCEIKPFNVKESLNFLKDIIPEINI